MQAIDYGWHFTLGTRDNKSYPAPLIYEKEKDLLIDLPDSCEKYTSIFKLYYNGTYYLECKIEKTDKEAQAKIKVMHLLGQPNEWYESAVVNIKNPISLKFILTSAFRALWVCQMSKGTIEIGLEEFEIDSDKFWESK